jgi:hypothetical protein
MLGQHERPEPSDLPDRRANPQALPNVPASSEAWSLCFGRIGMLSRSLAGANATGR